jgi:diguanylate cyclase (GGDEF)-like protein
MVCAESLRRQSIEAGESEASRRNGDSRRNTEIDNSYRARQTGFFQLFRAIVESDGKQRACVLSVAFLLVNSLLALITVSGLGLLLYGEVTYTEVVSGLATAVVVSGFMIIQGRAVTEQIRLGRTDLIESEERIRQIAHFDALTGLPNRILFKDRVTKALAEAVRNRDEFAILFLDLDRFKAINDTLGHHVGDEVLRVVSDRLAKTLRDVDTVSRLGGDEFVVLLPHTGAEGAIEVAEKIRSALAEPFTVDGQSLSITPSIGISSYPDDGLDMDTLIRHADAAMYHAKRKGRNGIHRFCGPTTQEAERERVAGEREMRVALARREFVLFYQPRIDAASGDVVGVQTLVRWNHPVKGWLAPETFGPLAEATGLIVPLSDWVVSEACRQNLRWQTRGLLKAPIVVRLSAQQLKQEDSIVRFSDTLGRTGLHPGDLELEVSASAAAELGVVMLERLRRLRELGIKVSICDFGAGAFRLSQLRTLPVDSIKIGRSFVRNLPGNQFDAIIVRSIIDLAHSAALRAVAEGVGNREQLEYLRDSGCDAFQGDIYGEPRAAGAFAETLVRLQHPVPQRWVA